MGSAVCHALRNSEQDFVPGAGFRLAHGRVLSVDLRLFRKLGVLNIVKEWIASNQYASSDVFCDKPAAS